MIIMGIWLAGAVLVMIMKCGKYFKNKSNSADFHSALYTQLPLQALNHVLWNVGFIKLRTLHKPALVLNDGAGVLSALVQSPRL